MNLIITVDLGITAALEVAYATTHGVDVIITDHHVPQEILPYAYAIVNQNYLQCTLMEQNILSRSDALWRRCCV